MFTYMMMMGEYWERMQYDLRIYLGPRCIYLIGHGCIPMEIKLKT